jgi:mono/diheme cytochrome c family protein
MNLSLMFNRKSALQSFILFSTIISTLSCERDYLQRPEPPKPKVPNETSTLEASFVNSAVNTVNAPYWKSADYKSVTLADLSTKNLYTEDGHLNMTGTFNGLSDFNNDGSEDLILKAAYDDENLYILAEWTDFKADAYRSSWFFDGQADPHKSDTTGGWTSQRNDDKLSLVFETSGISDFATTGCASTCHSNQKKTTAGIADLWKWSYAESEPFGYAINLSVNSTSGIDRDDASTHYQRNANDIASYRSAPKYEFNGVKQEITKADGSSTVLDPAYYLVNKTDFTGDAEKGYKLYLNHDKGCLGCHGEDGKGFGENGEGADFTNPLFNGYSRDFFIERSLDDNHAGKSYFQKLNTTEQQDIIARIRGFAGVPGYYFDSDVMTEQDIKASSSASVTKVNTKITTYKVLLIRKLATGKANDVQFDPLAKPSVPFGIALMDADGKNHIGSLLETLTFLEK